MTTLILHAVSVFLLLGLSAMAGGYAHEQLWFTKKKADPLARTVALVMAPWWIVLTLATMGPAFAWKVASNFWQLVTTGDYADDD